MIDRYLLRYFLAVVDLGNFSRAAAQENVSQPTLSVGIAKLETLLGRQLFHRTNRRVELTEAGARFAVHARRIEAEFNLAEAAASATPVRRSLRLGVLASAPIEWIADFVTLLSAADPSQRIELVEGRERDISEALSRGRIEVALTLIRPGASRFPNEVLKTEGYALAMPSTHAHANCDVIEPELLADSVMIVRRHCEVLSDTSRYFTRHGVRPFFAARTTSDQQTLTLVQAGLGVTVMPDCFAAPGVSRPKLAGFDLRRDIGIVYASSVEEARLGASLCMDALRKAVQRADSPVPLEEALFNSVCDASPLGTTR
jgi:DNA-binding transcriptional LysR family regulator